MIEQIKEKFEYLLSLNIIDQLKEILINTISILEQIIANWGIVIILIALLIIYLGLSILFKILKLAIIILAIALIALYSLYFFGYRLNISSSMPIGIYKFQKANSFKIGDTVEVCLPDNIAKYAFDRGYISKGSCENGYAPLIKEIIAIPNDYVAINESQIKVNDKVYFLKQKSFDKQNRMLTQQKIDQKINGYLLIGTESQNSWDSRYFGVIKPQYLKGIMKKVWIWQ